jgi:hypothetical protein
VRLSPSPFACLFLLASVTSAQAPTEPAAPTPKAVVLGQVSGCSLKLDPDPPVTSGGATIYTYDLKGCDKPTAIRSLTLNVNTAFPVTPDTSSQASMIVAINAGGTVEITFPSPVKADYKFSIAAQTNLSIASPTTSPFTLDMVDGTSSKDRSRSPPSALLIRLRGSRPSLRTRAQSMCLSASVLTLLSNRMRITTFPQTVSSSPRASDKASRKSYLALASPPAHLASPCATAVLAA